MSGQHEPAREESERDGGSDGGAPAEGPAAARPRTHDERAEPGAGAGAAGASAGALRADRAPSGDAEPDQPAGDRLLRSGHTSGQGEPGGGMGGSAGAFADGDPASGEVLAAELLASPVVEQADSVMAGKPRRASWYEARARWAVDVQARRATDALVLLEGRYPEAMRGLLPPMRSFVRYVRRPIRLISRAWRRSIQLRVVATTLLLSLGVVSLLGIVVIGQVRNGLLDAKRQSAESQALGGFKAAQDSADAPRDTHAQPAAGSTDGGTVDSGTFRNNLVQQLASGGQGLYAVVALPSEGEPQVSLNTGARGSRSTGNVLPEESISQELREALDRESGVHEQYTVMVRYDGQPNGSALVVGKRLNDVNNRPYQLYYLFPFTQEEDTLSLVKGTLATAGVFVVVLLGAIAWLVVRQVVTPVRMAARIAERLAAGRLQERMKVTGEDDIARLGQSFNKMAQNLQVKIQQLEDLSRMQRRFVSDVSHELRTPLTTVRMAADVIYDARGDFDPVTARSAELLGNQLDRFESLLSDLLEISRFDAGAAALDAEQVDLRDVVSRVLEGAEPLAERKGSALVLRGAQQPVLAKVDARRVERVLRNLVVNAVEYGEGRDVVVQLGVAPDGSAIAIAVRDYGVGLRPGESSRVFNRFWRADPARARSTGGTGLGLSIALEDARLHGGWLQAWGEPGGGSQFRLTLPADDGVTLQGSPLPLEPWDSRRNRGLNASGLPFRRAEAPPDVPADQAPRQQRQSISVPPRPQYPPRPVASPSALPGNNAQGTVSCVVGCPPEQVASPVQRSGAPPSGSDEVESTLDVEGFVDVEGGLVDSARTTPNHKSDQTGGSAVPRGGGAPTQSAGAGGAANVTDRDRPRQGRPVVSPGGTASPGLPAVQVDPRADAGVRDAQHQADPTPADTANEAAESGSAGRSLDGAMTREDEPHGH